MKVDRSECRKGTDFKQDIVEVLANICCITNSGYCFTKGIKYLTGKEYKLVL